MKTENIEKQIISYFEGELSEAQAQSLLVMIQEQKEHQQMFLAYQQIFEDIKQEQWEKPGQEMSGQFNSWLSEQQAQQYLQPSLKQRKGPNNSSWMAAAAIGILVIGACLGIVLKKNQLQQQEIIMLAKEMNQMKQTLTLAMLEENSASQRIQAINTLQTEAPQEENAIIQALLKRIEMDPNVNVRISASEALVHFPSGTTVEGLIQLLDQENDPRVQLSIIEVLVQLKAQKAIPSLEDLITKDSVAPVVKEQAAKSIEILI